MTANTADRLFLTTLILLVIAGIGGIYWMIVAETWWGRLGIFFGVGSGIYFVFMMAAFGFAAMANNDDRTKRRNTEQDSADNVDQNT